MDTLSLRKEARIYNGEKTMSLTSGAGNQALLQCHSHQDSMVLAQRQKYRSMEQNRKPRDKSMHIWSLLLLKDIFI